MIRELPVSFYRREDVVVIARELLGKVLCTRLNGILTSGIITETEAYAGVTDRASHAFGGRRTSRTEVMYHAGGEAYVYLCYGIHSLFNVVTANEGNPHAVLIRGISPLEGTDEMKNRTGKKENLLKSGSGPGNVSKLLGIHFSQSGMPLTKNANTERGSGNLWIEDRGYSVKETDIRSGPRIGVDYAGEDALLPYRFMIDPSLFK